MQNTPEELALFERVATMRQRHGVAINPDGSVIIRKLDKDGFMIEPAHGEPMPNFSDPVTALRWVERVDSRKPWELAWGGH